VSTTHYFNNVAQYPRLVWSFFTGFSDHVRGHAGAHLPTGTPRRAGRARPVLVRGRGPGRCVTSMVVRGGGDRGITLAVYGQFRQLQPGELLAEKQRKPRENNLHSQPRGGPVILWWARRVPVVTTGRLQWGLPVIRCRLKGWTSDRSGAGGLEGPTPSHAAWRPRFGRVSQIGSGPGMRPA